MMGPLESGHALRQQQRARVERIHLVSEYDIQRHHTGLGARKRATWRTTLVALALIGGSMAITVAGIWWLGSLAFWHAR